MTKVIADITTSLDGFVTAPNAGPQQGLGRSSWVGGTPLWSGVSRRELRQIDVRVSPDATHITYSSHRP